MIDALIDHSPALIIAIPLITAFATLFIDKINKNLRNICVLCALLLTLVLSLLLANEVLTNGIRLYVFGGEGFNIALPSGYSVPVRIMFIIDAFSAFMIVTISIITFLAGIYSLGFMSKETGQAKYYTLFLLLTTGLLGLVMTGDLFNMFVFLEIASMSAVGLIAFRNYRAESSEAAFKYLIVGALSAMMTLMAVAILYGQYNTMNIAALANRIQLSGFTFVDSIAFSLFIASFAMKLGAVPMHMWNIDAYSEAPAPITMVLVISSQAGIYALFRICFTLFGGGVNVPIESVGWIIIILGILSMFVGVTMAIVQHDIKRLMAFHAISQTGYMLLGIGVGLCLLNSPDLNTYGIKSMEGGIFHIINHAIYKGLLFLTAGAIFYRIGTRDLNKMGGLGHNMKYTMIFFMIGALAIAGIPPFNGFSSKFLIYESAYQLNPLLSIIAMIVSILTLASFVKVFHSVFMGPKKKEYKHVKEVPKSMLVVMGTLSMIIILFGLFPDLIIQYLVEPAARALIDPTTYRSILGVIL